ncbi:hypothetical protein ACWFRB_09125 [Rhodococcus sp. NPDC055112]
MTESNPPKPPVYDPEVWPLAPGNAPANYEAAFAKQVENYKVPLDPWQYDVIRRTIGRAQDLAVRERRD